MSYYFNGLVKNAVLHQAIDFVFLLLQIKIQ